MNALVKYVVLIGIALLLSVLLAYPTMILWNAYLVPAVTFAKEVEWGQMFGIMVLINLLFNMNVSSK